ncbi:hypothetical protein PPL_00404 [Heterostelium album PN500]|uniref:Uncharacterized protein n=1 Tax=Heterostelium pallidum (strain ATCC 26659 / Pp 5 / PN500) TaxID=670386 RepID=D3AWD0_HETP5|nr:hypothetical protein PPL_00404 [Heterostelium album PN500]EFA86603.1 hypothetical protein PPL_00404 [Heterostelium album PN500]|eukprot:XP_020438708.1 hypothetical protein PPL_00404 [Heterostelium album PN500]
MASGVKTIWNFSLEDENTKVEVDGYSIKVNDEKVRFRFDRREGSLSFDHRGHQFKVGTGPDVFLGFNLQLYMDNHNILNGKPYAPPRVGIFITIRLLGICIRNILWVFIGIFYILLYVPYLLYKLVIFLIFRRRIITISQISPPRSHSGEKINSENDSSETTPILTQIVIQPQTTDPQQSQDNLKIINITKQIFGFLTLKQTWYLY